MPFRKPRQLDDNRLTVADQEGKRFLVPENVRDNYLTITRPGKVGRRGKGYDREKTEKTEENDDPFYDDFNFGLNREKLPRTIPELDALDFASGANQPYSLLNHKDKQGTLTHYVVSEITLGQGGFGRVKLGQNLETGEFVAIKIIKGDSAHVELAGYKKVTGKDLPVVENKNKKYLVYPLAYGFSLWDVLYENSYRRKQPLNEKIDLALEVITAVQNFHNKKSVVHNDLNITNMMLDVDGAPENRISLIDFASTREKGENLFFEKSEDEISEALGEIKEANVAPQGNFDLDTFVLNLKDLFCKYKEKRNYSAKLSVLDNIEESIRCGLDSLKNNQKAIDILDQILTDISIVQDRMYQDPNHIRNTKESDIYSVGAALALIFSDRSFSGNTLSRFKHRPFLFELAIQKQIRECVVKPLLSKDLKKRNLQNVKDELLAIQASLRENPNAALKTNVNGYVATPLVLANILSARLALMQVDGLYDKGFQAFCESLRDPNDEEFGKFVDNLAGELATVGVFVLVISLILVGASYYQTCNERKEATNAPSLFGWSATQDTQKSDPPLEGQTPKGEFPVPKVL